VGSRSFELNLTLLNLMIGLCKGAIKKPSRRGLASQETRVYM
jgi:hypothetical protein